MAVHTIQDLYQMQALPLEIKIRMSKARIRAWIDEYGEDGVYISFSGGKDSTVLLNLIREDYPNVRAVFVDTGLEYPEIRDFVRTFDNVDIIKPKINFRQVIEKYGYPFISKEVSHKVYENRRKPDGSTKKYFISPKEGGKESRYNLSKYKFFLQAPFSLSHKCCNVMKKDPVKKYEKETKRVRITGELADESMQRITTWLKQGCNAFDNKRPVSKPLSFWTEQDILRYINEYNIEICKVYGDVVIDYDSEDQLSGQLDFSDLGLASDNRKLKTTGCSRTGCMFCGYGCHLEKESRFVKMKETHPKIYDYIMRPWEEEYEIEIPDKRYKTGIRKQKIKRLGLNYKEVIDWINDNSDLNIRY